MKSRQPKLVQQTGQSSTANSRFRVLAKLDIFRQYPMRHRYEVDVRCTTERQRDSAESKTNSSMDEVLSRFTIRANEFEITPVDKSRRKGKPRPD